MYFEYENNAKKMDCEISWDVVGAPGQKLTLDWIYYKK